MENISPNQNQAEDQENLEIANLEQEQENLENNPEDSEKTPEELAQDQEQIHQRIQEIEEEKRKRIENVAIFVEKAKEIVAEGGGMNIHYEKMQKAGIFELLPEHILNVIKENKKYDFIDYAAAELLLKENDLDNELESLQNQLSANKKNIENQESLKQDSLETLDEMQQNVEQESIKEAQQGENAEDIISEPELIDQ